MANYCYNCLLLTGGAEKVEAAKQLFLKIEADQEAKYTFYLPDFITASNSHMWDVQPEGEHIRFQTIGLPNLEALQQIADHFEVGFVNHYEEPNGYIYGEATYDGGLLSDISLNPADLAVYHFDQRKGKFIYGDKDFEWEADVIKAIFENKKQIILDRIARLSALYSGQDEDILFPKGLP
jgi:Ferredoxin-like domain in Api92-like protein